MAKQKTYATGEASGRTSLNLVDATAEAAAWANVAGTAQTSLAFWNQFIGLQSGVNPLDSTGIARLMCIVRAVSWVESQHGTGSGSSASVDPMQCGNPNDAWWKELTDCSQDQDRFVGGTAKPNYDACELPDKAAADASFPSQAYVSSLNNKATGHNDAKFNQVMSYCWGVPILIHKINTTAGDKTYQCGTLDRDRLADGAVAYNGGGDPAYRDKINATLDMVGCLAMLAVPESLMGPLLDPQTIIDNCEKEYPDNKDDCNKFVKAVSADLNVTLFSPGDNADAIVQRLRDAAAAGDWTKLDDGPDAKAKADAGQYVIAGLKGTDHNPPRDHGHVVVVVSGPLANGKYPSAYWGSISGTPGQNQTLNFAWNASDRDNVEYYGKALTTASLRSDTQDAQRSEETSALQIVQQIVKQLDVTEPGKPPRFFPSGIELIDLEVGVNPVKIVLKIAGPKAPAG